MKKNKTKNGRTFVSKIEKKCSNCVCRLNSPYSFNCIRCVQDSEWVYFNWEDADEKEK